MLDRAGLPQRLLPIINTRSKDINSAAGLRGDLGGFNVDLSFSYGRNTVDFRTLDSANYAYGTATPRSFRAGSVAYDQYVAGLDVTRKFDVFQSLNLAFGIEGGARAIRSARASRPPMAMRRPAPSPIPAGTTVAPGAQGFGASRRSTRPSAAAATAASMSMSRRR